jgi:Holliday junction resolvase RusA-like endonuclease
MRSTPEIEKAIAEAGVAGMRTVIPGHTLAPTPAAGDVVAEFEVPHRASPWKAPHVGRTGPPFKDKSLVAWQKTVADHASLSMRGRPPYPGPVLLEVHFHLTRRPGSAPDLSNLTKAFEDALQGVVIVNDRSVLKIVAQRSTGARDYVAARVISLMEPSC